MSLISNPLLAARAPAPLFPPSFHHIRRQQTPGNIPESELVDFACKGAKPAKNMIEALQCPQTEAMVQACTTGGRTIEEWNETDLAPYPEKSQCIKLCAAFQDGSFTTISLECAQKACADAEEQETNNRKYYEQMWIMMYRDVCERFDLIKAEDGPKKSEDQTVADKSEANDKTKDATSSTDKSAGSESAPTESESAGNSTKADDESGTSGLRMGGGWGISVVFAVVLGSVFSGLVV